MQGEPTARAPIARAALLAALENLSDELSTLPLPLRARQVEARRRERAELLAQLEDYLLPRLRAEGAPLLVVVGGSTGAGKSTLVNSLLGAPLTTPGVLRPTTRSPVLVHNPQDADWFGHERLLPHLVRSHARAVAGDDATAQELPHPPTGAAPDAAAHRSLRLAPSRRIPRGLALLDAPDIDSVEQANRELAQQLMAAADLWLFVTTPARYADAVPWSLLHAASQRRTQVAIVLDRLDAATRDVPEDLRGHMVRAGLEHARLFEIPETGLDDEGLLPEAAVAQLAGWLSDVAADGVERESIAHATRDGALDAVVAGVRALAEAAQDQARAEERLLVTVELAYGTAAETVIAATKDGGLLRGEVLARWQDVVGTSDMMRAIERGVGRTRDRVTAFLRGGSASAHQAEVAIAHGLAAVALDAVEGAREAVRTGWRVDPAGADLLDAIEHGTSLTPAGSAELRERIEREIREWQGEVLDLVREQGSSRRGLARALSFGVNGLGVALMLLVFAGTGGLTGAEVGIAGGTAVLAQKVLEAAFGDDAVRRLTATAQASLDRRLVGLIAADADAVEAIVRREQVDADAPERLRLVAAEIASALQGDRRESAAARVDAGSEPRPAESGEVTRLRGAGARGAVAPPAPAMPGRAASDPAPRRGWFARLFGRGGRG
ncbi:dynamin family protein [Serinibacter salmoneus]|uniref:Dynamin family protein n=1 Tax=Serinibacter salmoneus TaxID=556530 RepID=A0A2A9CZY5_9MICO|nr:dynamin family protein [Serinibacter salmoneus]PFG19953.1 dynamin family protein [Serinibacter salmoneus]